MILSFQAWIYWIRRLCANWSWKNELEKRIAVRMYKGHILIDIREIYQKDGEKKPGKKGISLNLEQYNTIMVRKTYR